MANIEKGSNNCSAVKLNIVEASEKGASTTLGQACMTPVKTIIKSVKAVPSKDAKQKLAPIFNRVFKRLNAIGKAIDSTGKCHTG